MAHAPQWTCSGRISLWRYTGNERNFPGWHLNADPAGCGCLLALLALLPGDDAPYRTIALTPPTAAQLSVPNNRHGIAAWVAPTRLRVRLADEPSLWAFPADLEPGTMTIGSHWIAPLRRGIDDIANGRGDYSIGGRGEDSLPLWFWW